MSELTSSDALISAAVDRAHKHVGGSKDSILAVQYAGITYLAVVLVMSAEYECVCWMYNATTSGLSDGAYGSAALPTFAKRLSKAQTTSPYFY